MIFIVQNNNLTYSVEFLPELMKISGSGVFLASNGCPNSSEAHDQRTSPDAGLHCRELAWSDGHDVTVCRISWDGLSRGPDSTCKRFPLSVGRRRIAENPITIEEDEGFSEPRTPVSEAPRQPPAMEAKSTF